MTKALKEHKKEVEQKRKRVTELEQSIKDDENRLLKLEEDYKTAVIENSENIDDLFYSMESIQKKLKADKHKLSTLKTVTEDHLRKSAYRVLEGFKDVKPAYNKRVEAVKNAIREEKERHEKVMAELVDDGEEINEEYISIAEQYYDLFDSHGISGRFKGRGIPAGHNKEIDRQEREERQRLIQESRLITGNVYSHIERVTEGSSLPFTLNE